MLLREFLSSDKSITDYGQWSDKKMPKSGSRFLLTKNKGYHLGAAWRWRVVDIHANATDYRLLVAYHATKQNYVCALGVNQLSDTLVLARLEYHSTHPGWHVHACCVQNEARHRGRWGYPEMRRLPRKGRYCRRTTFITSDADAMTIAARHFRIDDLRPRGVQTDLDLWPS